MYRIATHPTHPASAPEVMYAMSMDDVIQCHMALDVLDDAAEKAAEDRK